MTDHLERVRAITRLLPGAEERRDEDRTTFVVGDAAFARFERQGEAAIVRLLAGDDAAAPRWDEIALADDADWIAIEDAIARSWELAAPAGLLEAGGR